MSSWFHMDVDNLLVNGAGFDFKLLAGDIEAAESDVAMLPVDPVRV